MHQPRTTAAPTRPRVGFVQLGSRLHYALPLALQRAGLLERVYVDWYTKTGSIEAGASKLISLFKPDLGRRMLHRRCEELDPAKVERRAAVSQLLLQRAARGGMHRRWDAFMAAMQKAAKTSLRKGFGDANVLMGFIRENHPSLFQGAKARGLYAVGDQMIAPAAVEHEELSEQFRRWPDWQKAESIGYLPKVADLERQTWATLDHVTCASDYVKQGLLREGVSDERVSVLPYPLDTSHYPFVDRSRSREAGDPVTVGFVGHVNLRKGVPYFVEVAKRLKGRGIRFAMVGGVHLEPAVVEANRPFVDFIGPVPRSEVANWLSRFDLLLFPSTCEGSAAAVVEAMASGLPIVCSPNSGSIVRHGTEGYVLPYDQIDAMAEAVERLASNPGLRLEMGRAASGRAGAFTIDWYSRELAGMLTRLLSGSSPDDAQGIAPAQVTQHAAKL